MKNLTAIAIVFAVGMICFANLRSGPRAPSVAGPTAVAPEWSLKDVDGKTVRSTDFKGKVVILDFWATWCAPCRAEIPEFIALQKKYAKQGLVVVGLSVDEAGGDVVKRFAQELGINYPVVLADEKTENSFEGNEAVPTTFILDRGGRIVNQHLGFVAKEEFEKEIKPLLNP